MSKLPQNWVHSPIGKLCTLNNGRAFKPTEWSDTGLPIVRIQNLNKANAPFNYYQGEFDEKYHLKGGELLFAWSGTPGTSFGAHVWNGGEAVLNQHIFRIDFDGFYFDKRFFRHAINQTLDTLIDIAHGGVGLRHVTKGKFESTEIAIPPLPEQKRIADKLDATLARVDACRVRLDRITPLLKRFRQSVLAAATSGQLTADWREAEQQGYIDTEINQQGLDGNTQVGAGSTANTILEKNIDLLSNASGPRTVAPHVSLLSTNESAFDQLNLLNDDAGVVFKIPETWHWASLVGGIYSANYGTSSKSSKDGVMPVLRMGNLQNGKLDWNDLVYSANDDDNAKYALTSGDVLFNRTNSPELVGKTSIYRGERPAIFAGYLIRVRCNPRYLLAEYLNICLNSPYGKDYCWAVKSDGVSQSNINAEKLKNLPVPYCSIDEQTEIVRRVETLFAFSDRLEARLASARQAADRLTPSLLAKAFRGELVPQDPNDEPASELLKRLAAQRESLVKAPKTKRSVKAS